MSLGRTLLRFLFLSAIEAVEPREPIEIEPPAFPGISIRS